MPPLSNVLAISPPPLISSTVPGESQFATPAHSHSLWSSYTPVALCVTVWELLSSSPGEWVLKCYLGVWGEFTARPTSLPPLALSSIFLSKLI